MLIFKAYPTAGMRQLFVFVLLLFTAQIMGQSKPLFNVADMQISWEVDQNNHQGKARFLSALTLLNNKSAFPAKGWSLYFNLARTIDSESVTPPFHIEQINGDLYRLYCTGSGQFPRGIPVSVRFVASDWVVNFTDAPLGLYFVFDGKARAAEPVKNYRIIPSTQPKQYLRFPGDKIGLISAEDIYNRHSGIKDIAKEELPLVLPTPVSETKLPGQCVLSAASILEADPAFEREADYFRKVLSALGAGDKSAASTIRLVKNQMPEEAYSLVVRPGSVEVAAGSASGIFYGLQSLQALFPPVSSAAAINNITIPCVEIRDAPRFGYRSFMLDIARNFQTKKQLLKTIDLLAFYKINTFHLHFNDDEGWRIQMPSFPELTSIGAVRGSGFEDGSHLPPSYGSGPDTKTLPGSGFYTTQDFIEILQYARDRHIRIIPEIETPGHARAAIVSMKYRYNRLMKEGKKEEAEKYLLNEWADSSKYRSVQGWNDNVINVALPSAYAFLERIADDLKEIYSKAGVPLSMIHYGGDEVPSGVWERSPACRELMARDRMQSVNDLWYYYWGKINSMLNKKELKLYGWEEIAMRKTTLDGKPHVIPNPDFVKDRFQVDVWNNVLGWGAEDLAYRLANAGYQVVLSPVSNFYFDMAYQKSFDEPGYYWGGFLDVDKPFYFIPFDYFKNAKEDLMGNPLDRSIFIGKERLTEYGQQNIRGIQGLLWSENIINADRMEYMLLPKLLGMAERAWAPEPAWATEKDSAAAAASYMKAWSVFVNELGKRELPRLDHFAGGFKYRIPEPGATKIDGKVHANSEYPGLMIRYTTDGSDPTSNSAIYSQPIPDNGKVRLRLFSASGRGGRVSIPR